MVLLKDEKLTDPVVCGHSVSGSAWHVLPVYCWALPHEKVIACSRACNEL